MARVVVTGATGFIGGHLVSALERADRHVVTPPRNELETFEFSADDLVFHLAGMAHGNVEAAADDSLTKVNVELTVDLYRRALTAGANKFVWLSSIKVLGDNSELPLGTGAPYAPGDAYAQSKVQAEMALFDCASPDLPLFVVRPPLVYGPGVSANFLSLLGLALSGWPLPLATASAPRAWLSVHNLVSMLLALADQTVAEHHILHVSDDTQSSVADMLRALARAGHRTARLFPLPIWLLYTGFGLLGRRQQAVKLLAPLPVDDSAMRELLGWQPAVSQEEALQEVVAWYRASP